MLDKLLGLELEAHIIDEQGNLSNNVDAFFDHESTSPHFQKELAHSMLEVTADPSSDISELAHNMGAELSKAMDVADDLGLLLVPSTTIGKCTPIKREGARYKRKEIVLGSKNRTMEYHICGTHVHIDKDKDMVSQHTLMTSLDPLFVLMSSTPFFMGNNHLKDYRVKVYRDIVFKKLPLNGSLLGYVHDLEGLQKRIDDTYAAWLNQCNLHDVDTEGFTRLNACWGPLRFSEKTIESRTADANLLSNVLALSAVYAGLNRMIDDVEQINIQTHINPSYDVLKYFEVQGLRYGLENDGLHAYLSDVVSLAKNGLYEHELGYLEPFNKMLKDRKTFSDELMGYAKRKGFYDGNTITQEGARDVRLYIAQRFIADAKKVK